MYYAKVSRQIVAVVLSVVIGYAGSTAGTDADSHNTSTWKPTSPEEIPVSCGPIELTYEQAQGKSIGCPWNGQCDNRGLRDLWEYEQNDPITWIKLYFHVFRDDSGLDAVCTQQNVNDQVAQLNGDMLEYGIQFQYDLAFRDSSIFRYSLDFNQFDPMKNAFNIKPDSQCNIYVTDVNDPTFGQFSFGIFPWAGDALLTTGGIVMNTFQFTPFDARHTMTHEMGHNLGLWHVFTGHQETNQVWDCSYECAENTATGALDNSGDFCSDTPPQPAIQDCGPASGTDHCTGDPWPAFPNTNYMNYSATCKEEFTPQQTARIHCWTQDVLRGWVINPRIEIDTFFGKAPLTAKFTGSYRYAANSWSWDFGDGSTGSTASLSHTYTEAGLRDVSLEVQSDSGNYTMMRKAAMWVHADSLIPLETEGFQGNSVGVPVYARNSLPINELIIPFSWSGNLGLTFDSVSAVGLRTETFADAQVISLDPFNSRATARIQSVLGDPYLPPDTGKVLLIFFTLDSAATEEDSAVVSVNSYSIFNPRMSTIPGFYAVTGQSGTVKIGHCRKGDINGQDDGIDVSDLTYLVNYMFNSGSPPPIPDNADIDSNGNIDIADLTRLVTFMFNDGPAPSCN